MVKDKELAISRGKRIKSLREGAGLKQIDVAAALDTNETYISKIENGRQDLSLEKAIGLAVLFNTSLDYIALRV